MRLTIRLLPYDRWHEFSFPDTNLTVAQAKLHALKHWHLVSPSANLHVPAQKSSQTSTGSAGSGRRPRTAGATTGRLPFGSTAFHTVSSPGTVHEDSQDRRRASLSLSNYEEENILLQSVQDWAVVNEIVSKYCLLSVCGGHYLEDSRSLKNACVESDLLVLQIRSQTVCLPSETFWQPYLRLHCLRYHSTRPPNETTELQPNPKSWKPCLLIVSEGRLYIFSDEKKESVKSTSFELPPLQSVVIPSVSASMQQQGPSAIQGNLSSDVLHLRCEDDFSLYLKTAEKTTWPDLLNCLDHGGTAYGTVENNATLASRAEILQRAQRSHLGLLAPVASLEREISLSHSTRTRERASPVDQLTALLPSLDINPHANLRRVRSFSSPNTEKGRIIRNVSAGLTSSLAQIPASPPSFPSFINLNSRSPTRITTTSSVVAERARPKTAIAPNFARSETDPGRIFAGTGRALIARDERVVVTQPKVRRWNDVTSDDEFGWI